MRQKRTTRLTALAALLPLLLLNAGSARALYRCVYDDVARSECCCPKTAAAPTRTSHTAVSEASCCEVERSEAVQQGQARVERSELVQVRTPVAVVPVPRLLSAVHSALVEAQRMSAAADPPLGPPLLLLKCSFLI